MEESLIFSHITVCSFLEAAGVRCNPSTVCALFKHKALIPAQTQSSPPSCRVCARMRTCDCVIRCFGGTEHTGFGLSPQCKSIRCSRHVLMEIFELEDQWIYRVWKLTDSCYVWFKDGINIHLKTFIIKMLKWHFHFWIRCLPGILYLVQRTRTMVDKMHLFHSVWNMGYKLRDIRNIAGVLNPNILKNAFTKTDDGTAQWCFSI